MISSMALFLRLMPKPQEASSTDSFEWSRCSTGTAVLLQRRFFLVALLRLLTKGSGFWLATVPSATRSFMLTGSLFGAQSARTKRALDSALSGTLSIALRCGPVGYSILANTHG